MNLKMKKETLTDRIESINETIMELIEEYRTGERDAEDFFHEMHKKQWALKETISEIEEHEKHLAELKAADEAPAR